MVWLMTVPARRAREASYERQIQIDSQATIQSHVDDYWITATPSVTPTMLATRAPTYTPFPTYTPVPTQTPIGAIGGFVGGQPMECQGCTKYYINVRYTHYWPDTPPTQEEIEAGGDGVDLIRTDQCWQYSKSQKKCVSAMYSELPWRPFVDRAAACPFEWPLGTVVYDTFTGRSFTCLDRGTMQCYGDPRVCDVDILHNGKLPHDGQIHNSLIQIDWTNTIDW